MRFLKQYGFDVFLVIILVSLFIYSETRQTDIVVNAPQPPVENTPSDNETITPRDNTVQETPENNAGVSDLSSETEVIAEPAPAAPESSFPPITDAVNDAVRKAVVNILCYSQTSGALSPISGTGIIIDPRGVIATNAHIAQYFLLKDYRTQNFVTCVIRTGNPATNSFTARLLYLPPAWINENKTSITSDNPKGTGEHDFAFLLIDGTASGMGSPPSTFPFIATSAHNEMIRVGTEVLVAGYPAGFLGGITITKSLPLVSTVVSIQELFTFTENFLDVLSLGGSIVAQKGASGSPVVTGDGKLQGIVVTSTDAETTDERELAAVTTGHINRALSEFIGKTIRELLSGNLQDISDDFNEHTAPQLTQALADEIEK